MTNAKTSAHPEGKFVRVGELDIHYVELGQGAPLVLLHGGLVSNDPVWSGSPGAYVAHLAAFGEHFRVIAPDLRGHGKTVNNSHGPITYRQASDDALGLIDALQLEKPLLCGFSAGATIATMLAIRQPDAVRALVNHAGYDAFNPNPQAPAFVMCRSIFGGRPDATEANPAAMAQFFESQGMGAFVASLKADHAGTWQQLVTSLFDAMTSCPATFEDLRKITAPTLVLTGDRDMVCSVEEAVTAFRMLTKGQLGIVPGHGHYLPDAAIKMSIEFLLSVAG